MSFDDNLGAITMKAPMIDLVTAKLKLGLSQKTSLLSFIMVRPYIRVLGPWAIQFFKIK